MLEDRDESLFGTDDRVGGLKEQGFDLLVVQRGGGAFLATDARTSESACVAELMKLYRKLTEQTG